MRDRYIRDVVGAFLEASDGVSSGHRAFANAASMAGLDLGQLGEESLPERLLEQRMRSSNKQIDRKTLDFARRRRLLTQEGADIREANLRAKFVPTGKVRVVGTRIDAIRGVGGPGAYLNPPFGGLEAIVPTDGSPATILVKDLQRSLIDKGVSPTGMVAVSDRYVAGKKILAGNPDGLWGSTTEQNTRNYATSLGYQSLSITKSNIVPEGQAGWGRYRTVHISPAAFVRDLTTEKDTSLQTRVVEPGGETPRVEVPTKDVQNVLLKLGASRNALISSKTNDVDGILGARTKEEYRRIAAKFELKVDYLEAKNRRRTTVTAPKSTWERLQAEAAKVRQPIRTASTSIALRTDTTQVETSRETQLKTDTIEAKETAPESDKIPSDTTNVSDFLAKLKRFIEAVDVKKLSKRQLRERRDELKAGLPQLRAYQSSPELNDVIRIGEAKLKEIKDELARRSRREPAKAEPKKVVTKNGKTVEVPTKLPEEKETDYTLPLLLGGTAIVGWIAFRKKKPAQMPGVGYFPSMTASGWR